MRRKIWALLMTIMMITTMIPANVFAEDTGGNISTVPGELKITGAKNWDDTTEKYRPESITVNLYQKGVDAPKASQTISAADKWQYTFDISDWPLVDENGNPIEYTIGENPVMNYELTGTVDPNIDFEFPSAGKDAWKVINPCSQLDIVNTADEKSVIVAKMTDGSLVIWTVDPLTPAEAEAIRDSLNNVGGGVVSGTKTTVFINGTGSYLGKMHVTADAVSFDGSSSWAKFAVGTYSKGYKDSTVVTSLTNKLETTSISGTKTWKDNDNQDGKRPDKIKVNLFADGVATGDYVEVTAADNWQYSFTDLVKYNAEGKEIVYTVTEDSVAGYTPEVAENGTDITNTHAPELTTVSGTKAWDDADNQDGIRPNEITVNIKDADKVVDTITVKPDADGNWTYESKELPKYRDGQEIEYTVEEVKVPGYTSVATGLNLTNTHEIETVTVKGTKTWNDADNQDGKRPTSITVYVKDGDEVVDTITVAPDQDGNWTYESKELPKYRKGKVGEEIHYTVEEKAVVDYEKPIYDGNNITNTHTPEKTSISGHKVWNDDNDRDGNRPDSITINLLANGVKVDSKTVTEADGWKWEFKDLDKYADGNIINYTFTEDVVKNYSTSQSTKDNETTVTNQYTPEETSVTVTKAWNDADNQDGIRKDSVEVRLLADGVDTQKTITLNEENNWVGSFTGLKTYRRDHGTPIVYTVEEVEVPDGYTVEITGDAAKGYVVTNTHTPELINIPGVKTWNDADNQDGKRPESIIVSLFKKGDTENAVCTLTVSADDNWEYIFKDVPKYEKPGKEIEYVVKEEAVPEYETPVITGDVENGFEITNTHTPETLDVSVMKDWQDKDNQDGIRYDELTVHLYADGTEIDSKKLNDGNNWREVFTDLPKYKEGKEVVYTVEEDAVTDYNSELVSVGENSFKFINTHEIELVEISGVKTWIDNDDQDGMRPDSITVRLFADGKEHAKKVVSVNNETGEWTYSFGDLPKYKEGKVGQEIVYTVKEDKVSEYETSIDGYNVTNKHDIIKTSISGEKTWNDKDNQDGVRPDAIEIQLLANGTPTGETKKVTEADNWAWTFDNLDKYAKGEEITYTFAEVVVDDYSTDLNGTVVENNYAPKKTSVTVSKAWNDNNDQDGLRTESVVVNLLADGKDTGKTVTLNDDNNWIDTFADLDKYRDQGKEIVYTVEEANVPEGYDVKITGDKDNGFVITNTHVPEVTEVVGTKSWKDANDKDGKRPESITVNLLADGEEVQSIELKGSTNEWNYQFKELPKFKDGGKEITYTVTEDEVAGYETTIDGYKITNSRTIEVKTGDNFNPWIFGGIAILALIAAAVTLFTRRKRHA